MSLYCDSGRVSTEIKLGDQCYQLNGKVIGEFVCDEINNTDVVHGNEEVGWYVNNMHAVKGSGLAEHDILFYCPKEATIYGWHISDLVIYDKPKELSEFSVLDGKAIKECEHRERVYNNPDYVNGAWLFGGFVCHKGEIDWCCDCKRKPLTRPPQSWCYVEKEGAE